MTGRRIVLCLDGTWNSTYAKGVRDDGTSIAKPSNVLKLARAVLPLTRGDVSQIVYYDAGIGGEIDTDGGWSVLTGLQKKKQGLWALGFNANVEQALTFLTNNYQPDSGDRIYVYGFSRGAATARAIVKFIDWMGGLSSKRDAYYLPEILEFYRKNRSQKTFEDFKKARGLTIRRAGREFPRFEPLQAVEVEVLGVWDTVYALGSPTLKVARGAFHVDRKPPKIVKNAFHALALDEDRADFAPALWRGAYDHQQMVQMWFPGVHSNVGGGYPRDGMANVALKWMLERSREHGLEFDAEYIKHFRPYERDRLYNSKSLGYQFFDVVRFKKSGRNILRLPAQGNHQLHPSILTRSLATKTEIRKAVANAKSRDYQSDHYRPEPIRLYLEKQGDPIEYCEAWLSKPWQLGEAEDDAVHSPEDVEKMRARLRKILRDWFGKK